MSDVDPDTNLRESLIIAKRILRNLAEQRGALTGNVVEDDALALAERMVALDDWLRGGGFLPKPWHDVVIGKVCV